MRVCQAQYSTHRPAVSTTSLLLNFFFFKCNFQHLNHPYGMVKALGTSSRVTQTGLSEDKPAFQTTREIGTEMISLLTY